MTHLTQEQQAICNFARNTSESILVSALPGTGKTTTLVEVLKVLPQPSALVLSFNKPIADEMTRRKPPLPRNRIVHIKTLHAAGYWITRHHFPHVEVNRDITEERIRNAAGEGTPFRILGAATKLLRIVKDFQHETKLNLDVAWSLGYEFDCFSKLVNEHEVARTVEVVNRAYKASLIVDRAIDFPDQGWLPLVLGLDPPSRYKAILLDEAQDVNPNQLAMVERLLADGGRIIAAGDLNQQIYEWRGAIGTEVWDRMKQHHKARELPLTITWRCDTAIVREAQRLMPALRARPNAGPGRVTSIHEPAFFASLASGDYPEGSIFVLSRNNAELLRVALELWRRNVAFNLTQSGEVLTPLKTVINKLMRDDQRAPVKPTVSLTKNLSDEADIENALSLFHHRRQKGEERAAALARDAGLPQDSPQKAAFRQKLGAWYMTEMMKAQGAGSASYVERIEDQHRMILYALTYVRDPREIEPLLEQIFIIDETIDLTLSTVHKAKGLEADTVYLLRETFAAYQGRVDRDGNPKPIPREELNIEKVAITRARKALVWVRLSDEDPGDV